MAAPAALPPEYYGREQTFVKHLILGGYLQRVAWNILSVADGFTFVDGFSGPWEAKSVVYDDTSFGIAIRELRAIKAGFVARGTPKRLRCVFVEKEREAFERLSAAADGASDLSAKALHGTFEENIEEVRRYIGSTFALTFIDPTGWNFDLSRVAPLLRQRGEVLINFMYEHFKRFVEDQRPEIRASYDRPFGGIDWRTIIDEEMFYGADKEAAILEAFKQAVKEVGGFKYVASARIRHRLVNKSHFYLVYGTRHQKGLTEFRKVERQAVDTEELIRLEAKDRDLETRTGQIQMFAPAPPNAEAAVKNHWAVEVQRARLWSEELIAARPFISFEELSGRIQERISVLLPELKDLLVSMQRDGLVEFDGFVGRQRKPDNGTTIRATDRHKKSRAERLDGQNCNRPPNSKVPR